MARELERVIVRDKHVTYIVNPAFFKEDDMKAETLADYFDIEKYQLAGKVIHEYSGRGKAYLLSDMYKNRILLRHYWRGGMMFKLLKDKFFAYFDTAKRSDLEFSLLQTMRKMGLSVPKPIAARYVKKGMFITNDIILQEIPGAKTLLKILTERTLSNEEFAKIGDAVGKMMLAGIYHTDLNISNILIDGANNVWLIDFDKCFLKNINQKLYAKMVDRLARSFEKELENTPELHWSKSDFDKLEPVIRNAFLRSY